MNAAQKAISRDDRLAALRHAVYRDLIDYLPVANYDQARTFAVNLSLCRGFAAEPDAAKRERMVNAVLMRFLLLKVTPDVGVATHYAKATQAEIEKWIAAKYGDRLADIAGFHRRDERSPWRLNLPSRSAAYAYRSATGHYSGILFQPLDRHDSFFLLSSSKLGGPKAVRLTPRDQQYFTQFEEVYP